MVDIIEFIDFCKLLEMQGKVNYIHLQKSKYSYFFDELSKIISSKEPRQLLWHVINQNLSVQLCHCGNPVNWVKNSKSYRKTCSPQCAQVHRRKLRKPITIPYYKDPERLKSALEKRKANQLEKYGVEHHSQRLKVKEKIKATNVERYGVESPLQSEIIKEKIKSTLIERYGVDNSFKSPEIQEKRKQTNLARYGCEYPHQNLDVQAKHYSTMKERYGAEHPLQNPDIKLKQQITNLNRFGHVSPFGSDVIRQHIIDNNIAIYGVQNSSQIHIQPDIYELLQDKYKFELAIVNKTLFDICRTLNVSLRTVLNYLNKYNLRNLVSDVKISSYEIVVAELLDELGVTYIKNCRSVIAPNELDFYIQDYNLAIEVGSSYYHCELSANKDRMYHYNKWKQCADLGITLLQYFDNDILNNFHLIESKIKRLAYKSQPNIGARLLDINILDDFKTESEFLQINHLQGPTSNRNFVLTAYYNDEMVGLTTWLIKDHQAELVRYATNINCAYPGLFSKMENKFIKLTNFKGNLISFSDNRHSNGQLYKSNGFILEHVTKPGYTYTGDYLNFESRLKYQKHKLIEKFDLTEDISNITEWEIMQSQGYDRLWDAGQSKWTKLIS